MCLFIPHGGLHSGNRRLGVGPHFCPLLFQHPVQWTSAVPEKSVVEPRTDGHYVGRGSERLPRQPAHCGCIISAGTGMLKQHPHQVSPSRQDLLQRYRVLSKAEKDFGKIGKVTECVRMK